MASFLDSGYNGSIVSLAGVVGRHGYGLVIETAYLIITAGFTHERIAANPNRVWLLIQNNGLADLYVQPGSTAGPVSPHIAPGGSILFNRDMPWTGGISFASTADMAVAVQEASLAAT